jgi:23S rRNA (adenine2503-C2)-methyltransferase
LDGVNDSIEDAARLIQLTAEFNCHINIIPFNPRPGSLHKCPDDKDVEAFGKILLDAGVTASIRWPRGRDILAACGQLRSSQTD